MSRLILVPTALEAKGIFGQAPEGKGRIEIHGAELGICGFGPAAAGAFAAHHLAASSASSCLLLGIAGSYDLRRAPLGTVLEGSLVCSAGIGVGHGADHLSPADLGFPEPPTGESELTLVTNGVAPMAGILSVPAASANREEARALAEARPVCLLEDMETWAVALACHAAGVPLQVLRAVSNEAGDRDKANWQIGEALRAIASLL